MECGTRAIQSGPVPPLEQRLIRVKRRTQASASATRQVHMEHDRRERHDADSRLNDRKS